MKIVSTWRDYYDIALQQGRDDSVVFVRKTQSIVSQEWRYQGHDPIALERGFMYDGLPQSLDITRRKLGQLKLYAFRVALCGKIYGGIDLRYVAPGAMPAEGIHEHYYDADSLLARIVALGFEDEIFPDASSKQKRNFVMSDFLRSSQPVNSGFFVAHAEPITLVERREYTARYVTINPQLAALSFYKVLGPWEVFQEIEMFLGSLAAPENQPPVSIEDKYRIAQHGFDKMSFRKPPTKRLKG